MKVLALIPVEQDQKAKKRKKKRFNRRNSLTTGASGSHNRFNRRKVPVTGAPVQNRRRGNSEVVTGYLELGQLLD